MKITPHILLTCGYVIFVFLVLILTYNRLFYGVDFGDEAIYSASPYRFVLGDKRFIDDITLGQITFLIPFSLVKFYYEFTKTTEGLILFLRQSYFVFTVLISFLVYFSIKDFFDKRMALLVSLTCVTYALGNIFTFSYNTQACLLFTAGCFLGAWAIIKLSSYKSYIFLFLVGLLHGLASISYPPMGLPGLAFIFIASFWIEHHPFKKIGIYCIGLSIPLLFLFSLEGFTDYILVKFKTLTQTRFSYTAGTSVGTFEKIISLFTGIWHNYFYKLYTFIFIVGLMIFYKFYKNQSPWLILFLGFIVTIPFVNGVWELHYFSSSYYLIYYSLFAPYLFLFLDKKYDEIRKLFWIIWFPALIAGLTTGWASGNGWPNMAVGLLSGALITTLLLVTLISDVIQKMDYPPISFYFFRLLIPACVLVLMLFYNYGSVYGDGMSKITHLTAKVERGPYKGLYTTPSRQEFIKDLDQNLRKFIRENHKRILFYDLFAAGYLFTSLRPASTTVWQIPLGMYPNASRDSIIAYYKNKNNWPDIVVKMKTTFNPSGWTSRLETVHNDPLNRFIHQFYQLVFQGKDYFIFVNKRFSKKSYNK